MPTPTANLTGNIDAAVGEVLGIQATVRYSDAVWADETNNTVIVGGGVIPIGADGAVDVDLPQTTEAIRVGIELSYVDNATRQRTKLWSGWRELTTDTTFAEFWAFTPESPPLTDGERIAADLTDLDTRLGALEDAPAPDATLAGRVDGGNDHGAVSGTLTLDANEGTHALDATGTLSLTLDPTAPDFRIITLYVASGADNITVDGSPDIEFADGGFASFVRIRGAWVLASAGAPSDATPPTPIVGLNATGGETQIAASWPASTDAESSVAYRYRVWLTSGGAAGEWTSTTSASFTKTGLAAGDYTVEVYAYSDGGASATATDTATVTAPLAVDFLDTFTRANGSLSGAPTPNTGGNWAGSTATPNITSGTLVGTGQVIYATRGSSPAREASCTVTTTATSDVRFTAWSTAGDLNGPKAAILPSGQVSFQGITVGSTTFNASGGTNPFTPTGYLADGVHVVKVVSNANGTCHLVIDGTTVISAAYDTANAGRHFGVSVKGTVDNIEVKA